MPRIFLRLLTYRFWALLSILPFGPLSATAANEFFVATNGNDSWSGKLTEPNAAKTDGPFVTLKRARDEIRTFKAGGGPAAGVIVFVRGGTYSLPQTLKFEARDSGSPEAPVTYQAYEREAPVVIGGKPISGFKPYQGRILKADLATQGLKGVEFRQLFCNGRRMHLARYPNFDRENPYGGGWAYADGKPVPMYVSVPGEDTRTLHYKSSDARNWARPQEGVLVQRVCVPQSGGSITESIHPHGLYKLAGLGHSTRFSMAKWTLEMSMARRNSTHAFNMPIFAPSFTVEIGNFSETSQAEQITQVLDSKRG